MEERRGVMHWILGVALAIVFIVVIVFCVAIWLLEGM
jgi:hypothetical protein